MVKVIQIPVMTGPRLIDLKILAGGLALFQHRTCTAYVYNGRHFELHCVLVHQYQHLCSRGLGDDALYKSTFYTTSSTASANAVVNNNNNSRLDYVTMARFLDKLDVLLAQLVLQILNLEYNEASFPA